MEINHYASEEELISALKSATDWHSWLRAMEDVSCRLAMRRDQGAGGYDSAAAAALREAMHAEPSHELVSAHCGSHPDTHAWGRRVVQGGNAQGRIAALPRLQAGPHGGVI